MKAPRGFLPDVLLPLAPGGERRCCHGEGALPLSVRVCERLGDMLIVGSELQAELASHDEGALREIAPQVDDVLARIAALLERLAA